MRKLAQKTNVSVQSAHRTVSEELNLREERNHKLRTLDYTGNSTQIVRKQPQKSRTTTTTATATATVCSHTKERVGCGKQREATAPIHLW